MVGGRAVADTLCYRREMTRCGRALWVARRTQACRPLATTPLQILPAEWHNISHITDRRHHALHLRYHRDKSSFVRTGGSAMGRRPNAVVGEFFHRGQKLDDNSNRYQHTCKKCGQHVRKGSP